MTREEILDLLASYFIPVLDICKRLGIDLHDVLDRAERLEQLSHDEEDA